MSSGVLRRIGLAASLVAAPCSTPAQETSDTTREQVPDSARFELEGVAVEVTRPASTGGGASAVEIEMANVPVLPSPTLEEVLRKVPLLRVRTNSRGQAQPSMRGVEERQIAILVDGVPITLGWDNRTDLSVIPLTAAQEITVVRGLSSVLSGPNVLGGVINVGITRGPFPSEVRKPVSFRAAAAHGGAYGLSGEASRLFDLDAGRLLVRAGGGYRDSPGAILPGDLGRDLPERPNHPAAEGDHLLNTDMKQVNGFLALRLQGDGGGWASLSSMGHRSEKGVLPELHVDDPRLWRIPQEWRSLTALSAGTGWRATPWGEGDVEASVGLDFGHQEIDEFDSFAYAERVGGETNDSRTLSARAVADHTLGSGILRSSVTLVETHHEQRESDSDLTYEQRLWSFGTEVDHPLGSRAPGGLFWAPSMNAGVTLDGTSYPLTGDKPPQPGDWAWGARLAGSVLLGEGTARLHGGVSRKVRFAALRELFSGALGRFEPNPALGPEILKVGEVAVTSRLGPVRAQVTAFQQRLEDAVVRVALDDGKLQRQNRSEIRSTGVELLANWELRDVHFEGELTLQDVEVRDTDTSGGTGEPEYQPEIVSGLRVDAPLGPDTRIRGEIKHVGRQFCVNPDTGGTDAVDSSVYLEAGASRTVRAGGRSLPEMRLSVSATNLTDRVIFDQCGIPQAGRTFRIQLELF